MSFTSFLGKLGQQASSVFGNAIGSVGQVMNPTTAKQWYAQQSQNLVSSGQGNLYANSFFATCADITGGYVAMWTGSPASQHQALAAAAFSAPMFGVGGAVGSAWSTTQHLSSAFSVIHTSINSIISQTAVQNAPMQLLGLAGNAAGYYAKGLGWAGNVASSSQPVAQNIFLGASNQFNLFFNAARPLAATNWARVSYATSSLRFADKANSALNYGNPQVGGVLFDNCNAVLTGVAEITGGYWDAKTQSLVLVGKTESGGKAQELFLPRMDADNLKVALRAALAGLPLGVSIDAPADFRYGKQSDQMMPNGSPLVVSYLGQTAFTLSGAIMFEADRIMKCLSIGRDNKTGKPLSSKVPGYKDMFQMGWGNSAGENQSWHRFWFVIEGVELRKSPTSSAFVFGKVCIKVMTELELPNAPKGAVIDPNDLAFAHHLTDNYDAYAVEFPILSRLKELAKITSIAKYLVSQKIPLDLASLFKNPPVHVATPETTPSILRSESKDEGNVTHYRQLSGGVDMDKDPIIVADTMGAADNLEKSVSAARGDSVSEWQMPSAAVPLLAKALPLAGFKPFRRVVVDHQFPPVNGLPPLALRRSYDSSQMHSGEFGPGWSVYLPFSLTVLCHSGKRQEVLSPEELATQKDEICQLLLTDTHTGTAHFYRPTSVGKASGPIQFCRVITQTTQNKTVSFQCDPSDAIVNQNGQFHLQRNGFVYIFDETGTLLEVRSGATCIARFIRDNDRLTRLENAAEQRFTFEYDFANRVAKVSPSGVTDLTYHYNTTGGLREAKQGQAIKESYRYNTRGLLAQVRDASNTVLAHQCYDEVDNSSSASSDKVSFPFGVVVDRTFSSGRLATATDAQGCRVDLTYNPKGQLSEVIVKDRAGLTWKLQYSPNGGLHRFADPFRRSTETVADFNERITQVTLPDLRKMSCKRSVDGMLLELQSQSGEVCKRVFDGHNRLTGFSDSKEAITQVKYADNSGSEIGVTQFKSALESQSGTVQSTSFEQNGFSMTRTSDGKTDVTDLLFDGKTSKLTRTEHSVTFKNDGGMLISTRSEYNLEIHFA